MSITAYESALHHQSQAARFRAMAAKILDPRLRHMMLRIVELHEKIAAQLSRIGIRRINAESAIILW